MSAQTKLIERLAGARRPWSDTTAVESGEMVSVGAKLSASINIDLKEKNLLKNAAKLLGDELG